MSQHLSTRNISSKSMHAFLSNLANRQTNKHGQKIEWSFIFHLLNSSGSDKYNARSLKVWDFMTAHVIIDTGALRNISVWQTAAVFTQSISDLLAIVHVSAADAAVAYHHLPRHRISAHVCSVSSTSALLWRHAPRHVAHLRCLIGLWWRQRGLLFILYGPRITLSVACHAVIPAAQLAP